MNNPLAFFGAQKTRSTVAVAIALTLGGVLSSCAETPKSETTGSSTPSAEQSHEHAHSALEVEGAWAKSASAAGEHSMTGVFMSLKNTTDSAITIESAASDAAHMVELHETVADENGATVMQEVKGGFEVAAGATREFEPGADHVMLMGLHEDLIAGDELKVQLKLSNGESVEVVAQIRDFSGAQEEYAHDETAETDTEHDHKH